MTILYSFYSAEGIVFAADSRITRRGARGPLPAQSKVLPIPGLGESSGVIGYFGLAQVAGQPMDDWLRDVIAKYTFFNDADSFARYLIARIEGEGTPAELAEVSGFHIGTFDKRGAIVVPSFTFVRNAHTFQGGRYSNVGRFMLPDEQLLGRDLKAVPLAHVRDALRTRQKATGMPHWYRNGDVPYFGPITSLLEVALQGLVQQPKSRFCAPTSLDSWSRLARTLVASTGSLYRIYFAGVTPPVGDRVVVETVSWP